MNFNFTKLDPSCFNILPIRPAEDPVQSLSTIGINFSALDAEVCNLGFSAANYWNPLYTNFVTSSGDWDSVYTTVQSYSACWQSTYITVRDLSASWLSPITIVYPNVFNQDSFDRNTVETWVVANFPVSQGGCINYLDGQIMNVFSMEYAEANQEVTARCNAKKTTGQIKCIGIGYITAACGCTCQAAKVNCPDRYVNTVRGIELVVTNGAWVYNRDLY